MTSHFLLASLLLVGCGTAPIQRVPDTVRVPEPTAIRAEPSSISTPWWSDFADPSLGDLIAESRRSNFDLKAAVGRMKAAAAQAKAAGAPLWPQISASSNGARQQQVFVGLPIPGQTGPLQSTSTSYGVSLDVTWELDLWGRLGAGKAAAVADRQAAAATYNGAELSLEAQTAKAWFALTEAQLQHDLARATLENYDTSVQQIETRYRRGVRTSLDLRLTRVERANARDRLPVGQAEAGRRSQTDRSHARSLSNGRLQSGHRPPPPSPARSRQACRRSLSPGVPTSSSRSDTSRPPSCVSKKPGEHDTLEYRSPAQPGAPAISCPTCSTATSLSGASSETSSPPSFRVAESRPGSI